MTVFLVFGGLVYFTTGALAAWSDSPWGTGSLWRRIAIFLGWPIYVLVSLL